eukprot:TRINITY_DN55027_c0_g1_i1.p1 TRINITY_DN55027_c0_g1~~TRINITY_DN55027_c0_g1_i1.p1  ORF type:complete len:662 (+),score=66.15 TRINITY_DN55027_c0_g1_i1:156-2141(+)
MEPIASTPTHAWGGSSQYSVPPTTTPMMSVATSPAAWPQTSAAGPDVSSTTPRASRIFAFPSESVSVAPPVSPVFRNEFALNGQAEPIGTQPGSLVYLPRPANMMEPIEMPGSIFDMPGSVQQPIPVSVASLGPSDSRHRSNYTVGGYETAASRTYEPAQSRATQSMPPLFDTRSLESKQRTEQSGDNSRGSFQCRFSDASCQAADRQQRRAPMFPADEVTAVSLLPPATGEPSISMAGTPPTSRAKPSEKIRATSMPSFVPASEPKALEPARPVVAVPVAHALPPKKAVVLGQYVSASGPIKATTSDQQDSSPDKDVPKRKTNVSVSNAYVALIGLLTCFFMVALPVCGALTIAADENYLFWQGTSYPVTIIVLAAAVFVALFVSCRIFNSTARRQYLTELSVSLIASLFAAMFGVSLILFSVPASRSIHGTADALMEGCSNSLLASAALVDYNQVLVNLRSTPQCAVMDTVESCDGWSPNRYTRYIRYLEDEFDCGPMCPSIHPPYPSFLGVASTGAAPSAQLSFMKPSATVAATAARGEARRKRRASVASVADHPEAIAVDVAANASAAPPTVDGMGTALLERPIRGQTIGFAPRLFSQGMTRTTCLPLISTRLKVLAWTSSDFCFWQGCFFITFSIFASLGSFFTVCCCASHFERLK